MGYIPIVKNEKTQSDLYSRLLEDRIILLTGEVNESMAELVIAQLLYLDSINNEKEITIYINSPGGSINDGFAIYDAMQLVSAPISTVCIGLAASMASFLLASGDKGKRYITKNAEVLIHQPLIGGGISGQETDIMIHAEHLKDNRKRLENYLSEFTGKPLKEIHKDCERDNWMTAEEALEYGLVDEIITK